MAFQLMTLLLMCQGKKNNLPQSSCQGGGCREGSGGGGGDVFEVCRHETDVTECGAVPPSSFKTILINLASLLKIIGKIRK